MKFASAILSLSSLFIGTAGFAPINRGSFHKASTSLDVSFQEVPHKLTFVDSIEQIKAKPDQFLNKTVTAYELTNDCAVKVKCMAEGANMVGLTIGDADYGTYIWDNIEGAAYYGANSNAFPLKRGLILHGGVRFAAVTAEHGLYYDIPWDMSHEQHDDGSMSIVMSIVDNNENRERAYDREGQFRGTDMEGMSSDQFSSPPPHAGPMGKYPVTNMKFTYTVTLKDGEDFVRLNMQVENPTLDPQAAEAWLPMTFPITEESQILSRQQKRWKRDNWCFPALPNMVDWQSKQMKDLGFDKPLSWPTPSGGIFYDFPYMDGNFHGVYSPDKKNGIVFVAPGDASPHYTKMWSWGDKALFNRTEALKQNPPLAAGRPFAEYYEPWSSGFNFAFFQPTNFEARTINSWEVALFPLPMDLATSDNDELCDKIDTEINNRNIPASLSGVVTVPMDPLPK